MSLSVASIHHGLLYVLIFTGIGAANTLAVVTTNGAVTTYAQGGIMGSFSDIYKGKTMTEDGVYLVKGVTFMLSGTFDLGAITAKIVLGMPQVGDLRAVVTSYSSPFTTLAISPGESHFDFKLHLAPTSSWSTINPQKQLHTFQSMAAGGFAESVPEPASWALTILGMGAVGSVVRRKARSSHRPAPVLSD